MTKSRRGRGPRRRAQNPSPPPRTAADIYQEMMDEAGPSLGEPPAKRRKASTPQGTVPNDDNKSTIPMTGRDEASSVADGDGARKDSAGSRPVQTVYSEESSAEESSDAYDSESDGQYEKLMLQGLGEKESTNPEPSTVPVTFQQQQTKVKRKPQTRRSATAEFRKRQVDAHKLHLCCLLAHYHIRNQWCNDPEITRTLVDSALISDKVIDLLHERTAETRVERSQSLVRGLEDAAAVWKKAWKITQPSLSRAKWAESKAEFRSKQTDDAGFHLADFRKAAQTLTGSRDVGQQLFCALLRSLCLEVRLVCSLQVLPMTKLPVSLEFLQDVIDEDTKSSTPRIEPTRATGSRASTAAANDSPEAPPPIRRRLGGRGGADGSRNTRLDLGALPGNPKLGRHENMSWHPHPICWVEVWSPANQRWLPVDPLHSNTVARFNRFQPPEASKLAALHYAIAFSGESAARDVTRKYTARYNSKTRQHRVEMCSNGEQWLQRAMRIFKVPSTEVDYNANLNQIEDAEIARKERQEPIPKAAKDFKGHTLFALERHLRADQVIFPINVIGWVQIGAKHEPFYRASDVKTVRSADKWFRQFGRQVQPDQQPLKLKRKRRAAGGEPDEVGLYAEWQTKLFQPDPVREGRIPKNAFGNIDVYVPTMIPPGAVHIRCSEAVQAARIAGVDYADAVIGFAWQAGKGTATIHGIVVAAEYRPAIEAICLELWEVKRQAEREKEEQRLYGYWVHLTKCLQIREKARKLAAAAGPQKSDKKPAATHSDADAESDSDTDEYKDEGGFDEAQDADAATFGKRGAAMRPMKDKEVQAIKAVNQDTSKGFGFGFGSRRPKRAPRSKDYLETTVVSPWPSPLPEVVSPQAQPHQSQAGELADELSDEEGLFWDHEDGGGGGGGFIVKDSDVGGGGFIPEDSDTRGGGFIAEDLTAGGGGFIAEGSDTGGGGFIVEDSTAGGGGFIPEGSDTDGGGFIAEDYTAGGSIPELDKGDAIPKDAQTDSPALARNKPVHKSPTPPSAIEQAPQAPQASSHQATSEPPAEQQPSYRQPSDGEDDKGEDSCELRKLHKHRSSDDDLPSDLEFLDSDEELMW